MNEHKKNTLMVAVLSCLLLVIIVLAIVIGLVMNRSSESRNALEASGCTDLADDYEKVICLNDKVIDEEGNFSQELFETYLNDAFENEEYELASNLLIDRETALSAKQQCGEVAVLLDDDRVLAFPVDVLETYYSYAITAAIDCNDVEREDKLRRAKDELNVTNNSDMEYEEAAGVYNEETEDNVEGGLKDGE